MLTETPMVFGASALPALSLPETSERRLCGKCGAEYRVGELERGRGRRYDEHPFHFFAACGHNVTWFGSRPAPANLEAPK